MSNTPIGHILVPRQIKMVHHADHISTIYFQQNLKTTILATKKHLTELLFLNFVDSRCESLGIDSNLIQILMTFEASSSRPQNSKSKKQYMGVINVMCHFI